MYVCMHASEQSATQPTKPVKIMPMKSNLVDLIDLFTKETVQLQTLIHDAFNEDNHKALTPASPNSFEKKTDLLDHVFNSQGLVFNRSRTYKIARGVNAGREKCPRSAT
jgi:hypothetical protein